MSPLSRGYESSTAPSSSLLLRAAASPAGGDLYTDTENALGRASPISSLMSPSGCSSLDAAVAVGVIGIAAISDKRLFSNASSSASSSASLKLRSAEESELLFEYVSVGVVKTVGVGVGIGDGDDDAGDESCGESFGGVGPTEGGSNAGAAAEGVALAGNIAVGCALSNESSSTPVALTVASAAPLAARASVFGARLLSASAVSSCCRRVSISRRSRYV